MRPLQLPAPPPRLALLVPQAKAVPDGGRGPSTEDRWSAHRASRRAQGLCMRCGGKWARDHQCPKRFSYILCKSFLMYCKWKTLKSLTMVLQTTLKNSCFSRSQLLLYQEFLFLGPCVSRVSWVPNTSVSFWTLGVHILSLTLRWQHNSILCRSYLLHYGFR